MNEGLKIDPDEILEKGTPAYITALITAVKSGDNRCGEVEVTAYAQMVYELEVVRRLPLEEAEELLAQLPHASLKDVRGQALIEAVVYNQNLKVANAAERFYEKTNEFAANLTEYRIRLCSRFSGLADIMWSHNHAHLLPQETNFETYAFFLERWFLRPETKRAVLMKNLALLAEGKLPPEYQLLTLMLVKFEDETGLEAALAAFLDFEPRVRAGFLAKLREDVDFEDYLDNVVRDFARDFSVDQARLLLTRFEEASSAAT